jgi:hypothetical protein
MYAPICFFYSKQQKLFRFYRSDQNYRVRGRELGKVKGGVEMCMFQGCEPLFIVARTGNGNDVCKSIALKRNFTEIIKIKKFSILFSMALH